MRQLDLFAGIGGFSLAASWFGIQTTQFVEIDPYCQRVLTKNFPGVPIHDDITNYHPRLGEFDIITAGFPCQDLSSANPNGRGLEGRRSGLFFEVVRILRTVRPRFLLLENVPNLINRGLDRVLWEIAQSGFDAEWQVVSAASVGAPHQRERVFIIAYSQSPRAGRFNLPQTRPNLAPFSRNSFWQQNPHPEPTTYEAKRGFCYLDDGLSEWLACLTNLPVESVLSLIANRFKGFELYATTNEATRKILRVLWELANSQTDAGRRFGNLCPIPDKEILQYHLHGWGTNKASGVNDSKRNTKPSPETEKNILRELQRNGKPSHSPQGWQLEKQRGVKLTDSLRFLSFKTPSPAMAGTKTSKEVLYLWLNLPSTEKRNVWETLATVQEIWRSFADETGREWIVPPSSSFTTGLDTKQLKALGNTVVPQCAAITYQRILEINHGFKPF